MGKQEGKAETTRALGSGDEREGQGPRSGGEGIKPGFPNTEGAQVGTGSLCLGARGQKAQRILVCLSQR